VKKYIFLCSFALIGFSITSHAGSAVVSAEDLGDKWPLTIDSVVLRCKPHPNNEKAKMVWFSIDASHFYALNGTAISNAEKHGWIKDIKPIWKKDPKYPEIRVSVGPLIEKGLSLCP
jgi:hypothetical protein